MRDPSRFPTTRDGTGTPRWVKVVGIAVAVLILLVVVMMLLGGGSGSGAGGHGPQRHGLADLTAPAGVV
jgi:hypothetical protein